MKIDINIDNDQMDVITLINLKEAYKLSDDDQIRLALNIVINYFSNDDDCEQWAIEKSNYTK